MSFENDIAPTSRRNPKLLRVLLYAALTYVLPAQLHASAPPQTAVHASEDRLSETELGPGRLKHQVRVTVETNAAPVGATTNAVTSKEKSFQWKFSWGEWDGVHYDLSRRTRIKEPLAGFRERLEGTNAYQVFHLEELKMSGKFGAKLQVDAADFVTSKSFPPIDNGIEVRRARVYAQGDCVLLMPVSYELELGYIPNQFYIENSYLAFRNLPWIGEIKFGQYQTPMSLEAVTSSRDITMMELAGPVAALAPGVNAGIEIGRPVFEQRATWKLGLFTAGEGTQDTGDAASNYGRAITRITALPIYEADPERPSAATLLHLGLSANYLYSADNSVRYRSRPESHLAPYVVDTGNINANGALVAGGEAAWVKGPFSVQSEYLHSWVNEKDGQVPGFDGLYASVSYFLTGESRPYDRRNGCFTRVIPHQHFDWGHGGWGAWEVAARASYVNLTSADVQGGRLSMLMTGVNWYLHSHVKWRFEYGFGHVAERQPEGNISVFQTRMEVDF